MSKDTEENEKMEIVIYENQRWWLGQGWVDKTLSSERANWSDLTGHMYLPKGAVRTPGKNWIWVSEWQIQANTHKEFYLIRENSKNIDHDGSYDPEGW